MFNLINLKVTGFIDKCWQLTAKIQPVNFIFFGDTILHYSSQVLFLRVNNCDRAGKLHYSKLSICAVFFSSAILFKKVHCLKHMVLNMDQTP